MDRPEQRPLAGLDEVGRVQLGGQIFFKAVMAGQGHVPCPLSSRRTQRRRFCVNTSSNFIASAAPIGAKEETISLTSKARSSPAAMNAGIPHPLHVTNNITYGFAAQAKTGIG
jgi:hypothetical protein